MKLKLLLNKLTPYFPDYELSVLNNLLITVITVLQHRTVCINKLKSGVGLITGYTGTKSSSHYVRLIRFFKKNSSGSLWIDIVKCGLQLIDLKTLYLVLDGTSWKKGSVWQHYITLCIVYRGVAIPIFWIDLAKRGASSTEERQTLFDAAIKHFKLKGKILLADREYIGKEWFNYLIDNGIDFIIRSRDYAYFEFIDQNSSGLSVEDMIAKVLGSKVSNKALQKSFQLNPGGVTLWIVVARNPHPDGKEEFMILITSLKQSVYVTVADYLKRWKIEHCFKQLKSNGFDLEKLNLGSVQRRRLMVAVVVLAYIIAIVESLKNFKSTVKLKRHGSKGSIYHAQSVFRYGIDKIAAHLKEVTVFTQYFNRMLYDALKGYRSANILNV